MAETKTFTFPIDQLTPQGQNLLTFAQRYPAQFGLATVLIVAGVATIVVPLVLGFTVLGPAAGSIAAAWQAAIGNVVAGSFFATMQSMTMTGTLLSVGGGLIGLGVGVGILAFVGRREWEKGVEWAKGVNWAEGTQWAGWAQEAGMAGNEAWVKGEMLARSVDWAEAKRRAEWAMREALKGAEWAWAGGWW